jgi:hypothetical protein
MPGRQRCRQRSGRSRYGPIHWIAFSAFTTGPSKRLPIPNNDLRRAKSALGSLQRLIKQDTPSRRSNRECSRPSFERRGGGGRPLAIVESARSPTLTRCGRETLGRSAASWGVRASSSSTIRTPLPARSRLVSEYRSRHHSLDVRPRPLGLSYFLRPSIPDKVLPSIFGITPRHAQLLDDDQRSSHHPCTTPGAPRS